MHVIGELILAALIAYGGYAAIHSITAGVAARLPAPSRGAASVRGAASKGRGGARQGARSTRGTSGASGTAAIWARARSEDWLERRRRSRARRDERRANRASREPRERRHWRIPHPRVAFKVPGVTDQPPAGPQAVPALRPAAAVAAVPAIPQPATIPAVQPREAAPMTTPRGSVTPHHAALNAYVANFEAESDGDLIRFMAGEAAGMSGYANAMEQVQEHLLNKVGLDPAAVQLIMEYAQAAAAAATIMTQANARFQQVYQGVRETVAGGTVLPFDGRWVTAESA